MNRLTTQQRKLLYAVLIVLLAIPVYLLGAPAVEDSADNAGKLARLRQQYELGDATLGNVDPSSATMNLVLLGLRGLAANQLWLQHDELMRTKNWAQMRAVTDSILTLQPHFVEVWHFHSWSLAYNVSAEWDLVEDRYYWVKEGAKFLMDGVDKNRRSSELPWVMGRTLGHKMGRSDEWMFFRRFFKRDPDIERYKGGQDPEIALNPQSGEAFTDNFLAAKMWYGAANAVEERYGQNMMMRPLFRHYPQRAQFDYAESLQRDARVSDTANLPSLGGEIDWDRVWLEAQAAWEEAYLEWTTIYGRDAIRSPELGLDEPIYLESTPEEIARMEPAARKALDIYLNVTNYRYWKARALLERSPVMTQARRNMATGQRLIRQGDLDFVDGQPPESLKRLREGMAQFEQALQHLAQTASQESDQIAQDDLILEEALMAVLYYRYVLELESNKRYEVEGYSLDDFPLKAQWDAASSEEQILPELRQRFERELRIR